MPDLHQLLSREADRYLPAATPEFDALLIRATRRRKRKVLVMTATVAVATAGTVGAVALAHEGHRASRLTSDNGSTDARQVDRHAEPPRRTSTGPFPAPAYPACTASQVHAGSGGTIPDTASIVIVTNVSHARCSLSGYPTSIVGVHPDGTRRTIQVWDHYVKQFAGWYSWPANLRPGGRATIAVIWSTDCATTTQDGSATRFARVVLGLPGGGTISAPAEFNSVCGIGYSRFGTEPPPSRATHAPA